MVSPEKIIAAVSPELYSGNSKEDIKKMNELMSEGKFSEATKIVDGEHAMIHKGEFNDGFTIEQDEGFALDEKGKIGTEDVKKLSYETYAETLEPIYYYIHDFMGKMFKVDKLIDNFQSAPGSQHFSEQGQKKTIMQQQAGKIMGDINTVLRSVLNLIYDMKEFKIRLQSYDDLKDKEKAEHAKLSLKQLWMDKVDMNKGNSSLKAMALGQAGFVTLIDAFLAAKSADDVKKMDLNDRVKRILQPRVAEYDIWVAESEKELRKRYEIERSYLQSQVSSLKLYANWAKPYLQQAKNLEQKEGSEKNSEIVTAFNRTIIQVTLFGVGKGPIDPSDVADAGHGDFYKNKSWAKKNLRKYFPCLLVDFKFRAVPQQGNFIGKVDVSFKTYSLNNEEIDAFRKAIKEDDLSSGLDLIQGATDESISQLKEDIKYFLGEEDEEEKTKEKAKKKSSGENPFLALFGYYNESASKKEKKKDEKKGYAYKKDSTYEKPLRAAAATAALLNSFTIYDIYKKAHGMPSYT